VANAAPALLGKADGAVAYPAGSKEALAILRGKMRPAM